MRQYKINNQEQNQKSSFEQINHKSLGYGKISTL